MMIKPRYLVLALGTAVIILALVFSFGTPRLYALEKDSFATRFHDNAEALKGTTLNSTTDINPELQNMIDLTGPISLNIRIHDAEQAKRQLDLFAKSGASIKNLVVKLDMNESEIRELEQNSALQRQLLDSLMNSSVTLDLLQSMEVQYREQGNEDMLTTIRLQGNDLRKKVRAYHDKYHNASEKVVSLGAKFGLNTTQTEESQKHVDEIIRQLEEPQVLREMPVDTILIPGDERISLFVRPEMGRYRDTIQYMGISLTVRGNTTLRAANETVTLYNDDTPFSRLVTDKFGYYSVKIPLERTPAGTHNIYARSSSARSVNRTLTIISVDSATTLSVNKTDKYGIVNCSGSVMANMPVRSASVDIVWDDSHVSITKTNASGYFMKSLELPPGRHTVYARFSDTGYPIRPSESEPVTVDIPLIEGFEPDTQILEMVLAAAGILVLFSGAAIYYLRRIDRKRDLAAENTGEDSADSVFDPWEPEVEIGETGGGAEASAGETFIEFYTRILQEQGLNAASRIAYQQLAGRIAQDLRIRRHHAMTARELSRNCRGKPYCGAFARFIQVYEKVRYGGRVSEKDREVFETAMTITDEMTGRENH